MLTSRIIPLAVCGKELYIHKTFVLPLFFPPVVLFSWYSPFEEQTPVAINAEPVSNSLHQEESGNSTAVLKGSKDVNKKREELKAGPKKPKEKIDAISQFDLNNYASMY